MFLTTSGALFRSTSLKPTLEVSGTTRGFGGHDGAGLRAALQPETRQKIVRNIRIRTFRMSMRITPDRFFLYCFLRELKKCM